MRATYDVAEPGVIFVDRVTGLDKLYFLEEDDEGELVRVPYEVAAG